MSFYLLEIGCEELPSAFVPFTVQHLHNKIKAELDSLHLPVSQIKSGGTPRRVYLYLDGLPEMQADREEIVQGPPAKIAFNADGTVSDLGLKFSDSKGLDRSTLKKVSTDKGEYLTGSKKIAGKVTSVLMGELITSLIKTIPFPKSMRWGDGDIRFGRPLKYIMSVWDGKVLPLGIDGYEAVNTSVGHRFLSPEKFTVTDFNSYLSELKKRYVVVDESDRIELIKQQFTDLAKKGGYDVDQDEGLLRTVANLVEYPFAIEGRFEESFLQLPSPVLITSMKHHQRYFPTYKGGKLQSTFIGVANTKINDPEVIRAGYQRVLRARLNDALFFYNNDKVTPLESRVEMLKKVVYQEKLGTSYEKMERFRAVGGFLASHLSKESKDKVELAATLCKADLMCEMVYEFPELQGFMGKVYAEIQGKDKDVAIAIEEHYMPRFAGDSVPTGIVGKIVAVSDKVDTIVGAFSVGMIPSGNEDPYGLRRNAIGIINIIEESNWRIPLRLIVANALEQMKGRATVDSNTTADKVISFFMQRQKQMLISRDGVNKVDADAFDAAAISFDDLNMQRDRAVALTKAKKSEHFQSVSQSFKRINNILKKNTGASNVVDAKLFEHDEETLLYKLLQEKTATVTTLISKEKWDEALSELLIFADPLDRFFDKVMVMAEDLSVRGNRLALLLLLRNIFISVGDLSEIIC